MWGGEERGWGGGRCCSEGGIRERWEGEREKPLEERGDEIDAEGRKGE